MGVNPDLLVIKKPGDLDEAATFDPGDFLFAGPDNVLKRMPTENFYPLFKNIKPISPQDPGPFESNTLYKPYIYSEDPGINYPNAGNLKAIEGYDTLFYYNGTTWSKMANKLPRDEDARNVLKSFVNPQGDGPWETIPFPNADYPGYILNQNGVAEGNSSGAWGEIQASALAGASSIRLVADGMDLFGGTIAWWIGFRANNTFDVLKMGVIGTGVAQITLDDQYVYYKYSRPTFGTPKLEKQSKIALPVEEDSVMKTIKSLGSGYSGVIDLATLGLKESNTAAQNTTIINEAIANNPTKEILFPNGSFKVNEIVPVAGTSFRGSGGARSRLYTDVGSTARSIIRLLDGQTARGSIRDLFIDARNTTEGGIYLNNTFDYQIDNCIVFSNAQYGIKMVGGLYHSISNVYFDGGDISLITDHVTGSMGTNLIKYDRIYIVKSKKKCVEINGGSNYVFNSCNFEDCGTSGDENTGGVHAIGVSAGGEGVDVVFNNCWAEGVRGGFIYKLDNCKGNSVIRDCMMGNGGNGTGTIANAIINVGSNLLLSGATRFSTAPHFNPFPTNVRTIGSTTYVDNPNINIGINNVGSIKTAQYS
ncbi:right-handed parallel beta-helix repeat-containing protein [Chryseobacterium arthrosphaerae]